MHMFYGLLLTLRCTQSYGGNGELSAGRDRLQEPVTSGVTAMNAGSTDQWMEQWWFDRWWSAIVATIDDVVEMATMRGCSAGAQNGDSASLPAVATVGNFEPRRGVNKAVGKRLRWSEQWLLRVARTRLAVPAYKAVERLFDT